MPLPSHALCEAATQCSTEVAMEVPCPACTFLNALGPGGGSCELCGAALAGAAPAGPGWHCRTCGSRANADPAGLACAQCLARRRLWDCPNCTLENEIAKARCRACDAANPTRPPLPAIRMPKANSAPVVKTSGKKASSDSGGELCPSCGQKKTFLPPISGDAKRRSCGVCDGNSAASPPPLSPRQASSALELRRAVDEVTAGETWERIVGLCKATGERFVDDSFRPSGASLGDLSFLDPQHRQRLGDLVWARPHHIHTRDGRGSRWALFRDPHPADIQQGILGNCWFLSAMAVVAERPDLLRRIFLTQDYSPQGAYQIRLCIDGEWKIMIVDDLFPVFKSTMMMAFTEGRRNQLWVPLIEKALAKALGGYSALIAGRSSEGLAILTGANCTTIQLQLRDKDASTATQAGVHCGDLDVAWAHLLSSKEAGFLMGCSCGAGVDSVPEEEYAAKGLISRHAYSLLHAVEIHGLRLVKLRNPWGGEWKWRGDWGENSSLWTPQMRALLITEKSPAQLAGVFWMPYEQFTRYFDSVDVCRVRDSRWSEIRVPTFLPPHILPGFMHPLRLIVTETTEVELTLYQDGHRQAEQRRFGTVDLGLVVLKEGPEGHSAGYALSSKRVVGPFTSLQDILQPGSYLVVPLAFNHWGMQLRASEMPKAVIAVHTSKPVVTEMFSADPALLGEAVIQQTIHWGKKRDLGLDGIEAFLIERGFAGQAFVVANHFPDRWVEVSLDISESMNAVSTRGSLSTRDFIPPLHRMVVFLLSQMEASSSFYVAHSSSYRALSPSAPRPAKVHSPPLPPSTLGLHRPRSIWE